MRECQWDALQERPLAQTVVCFLSSFLPTLCARNGFVSTPPACREGKGARRIQWGQFWSIQTTEENTCTDQQRSRNTFQIFTFSNFQSSRTAFDWNRSGRTLSNSNDFDTAAYKMETLFAGYPGENQSKKRESRKNCFCGTLGLYALNRTNAQKC